MQAKVGCEYLSDLPSYKRKVWQEMKRLNLADYEERQLEDLKNCYTPLIPDRPYREMRWSDERKDKRCVHKKEDFPLSQNGSVRGGTLPYPVRAVRFVYCLCSRLHQKDNKKSFLK